MRKPVATLTLARPHPPRKVYPDLSHAEDWDAAIAETSFVPDHLVADLADAYGLIGIADDGDRQHERPPE